MDLTQNSGLHPIPNRLWVQLEEFGDLVDRYELVHATGGYLRRIEPKLSARVSQASGGKGQRSGGSRRTTPGDGKQHAGQGDPVAADRPGSTAKTKTTGAVARNCCPAAAATRACFNAARRTT